MLSDLTLRPLNANAYSEQAFTFIEPAALRNLANITAIDLIENGGRVARENWQNQQLTNLLRHAQAHSKFWRKRLPTGPVNHEAIKYLPAQSRSDINEQVKREGSLVAAKDDTSLSSYASTGSTGTPVKVHVTQDNGYYTVIRSLAQYFINGFSLDENRTQINPPTSFAKLADRSLAVTRAASWAGPLGKIFHTGYAKTIVYQHDDAALIDELCKDRIGYLVCPSRYIEILLKKGGVELIRKLGIKLWVHLSDHRDPEIVAALQGLGVPSLSNYSAGEIGPIAYECSKYPGNYHVAHTNVIVESDELETASFNNVAVGRLLVTHLHSYATPIIRYDVGDFAKMSPQCPCGHNGSTISYIFGRGKHFLRHPNGKLLPFYLSTRTLLEAATFEECRVRQDSVDTIILEVGGRENITADEATRLQYLILRVTDPAFKVRIIPVKTIDWSGNSKRLFFTSSVA